MAHNKKAAPAAGTGTAQRNTSSVRNSTAPTVSGQCAEVLAIIAEHQPVLSFVLTADFAIPEAAARVYDLRAMGFDVRTTIHAEVVFRGRIRRNVASYTLGTPSWPSPEFIAREVTP